MCELNWYLGTRVVLPAAISVGLTKWVKEKVKAKEGNGTDAAGDSKRRSHLNA
jgi:hypothetical protein